MVFFGELSYSRGKSVGTGSFSENNFDESQLSALETKFAHYLSAAEASSQNIAQEKDKIKTLIADISHQTKTPIANLLLYSELLKEETLPASAKANVDLAVARLDGHHRHAEHAAQVVVIQLCAA